MPFRQLGKCGACGCAIYDREGASGACSCDDGVLTTILLRDGTPVRANQNGDQLPDLPVELLMSRTALAEVAGARAFADHRHRDADPFDLNLDNLDVTFASAGDISFDLDDSTWPADLNRPTTPSRDRFRVDRVPVRAPFQGRLASGPSDGEVVGRVGQRLGQPQPAQRWVDRGSDRVVVATITPSKAPPRPTQPSRPAPSALERLGSLDIGSKDPFK